MEYLGRHVLPKRLFNESVGDVIAQYHYDRRFYYQLVRDPYFYKILQAEKTEKATVHLMNVLGCPRSQAQAILDQMRSAADNKMKSRNNPSGPQSGGQQPEKEPAVTICKPTGE